MNRATQFRLGVLLWAALSVAHASFAAPADSRLAVVIANGKYASLGELKNPGQDGQLVSAALRSAGFNVVYLHDLDDSQMRSTLRQLAKDSAKREVTLVYYAGHGVQIGGVNYLLPVDISPPEQEDDVRLASVSADDVLSVIKSPYKIVILDACRDNPILSRALSRGRGAVFHRGLAPTAPVAEQTGGVFIAYSTQTDAVAIDGEGAYSPFAESFAKYVGINASIDDMFARVTHDVLQKTKGFQRPFKYASLDTVFCLTGACAPATQTIQGNTAGGLKSQAAAGGQGIDYIAALTSTAGEQQRRQIEDSLFERLLGWLPKLIYYGLGSNADGSKGAFGFAPSTVRKDGGRYSVTVKSFNLGEKGKLSDSGWISDYVIDCQQHQLVQVSWQMNGGAKYFSQAEQKTNAISIQSSSIFGSLEAALCSAPLRFSPLWAIDSLQWSPLGPAVEAARDVVYKDPATSNIRYVLVRAYLSAPDLLGAVRSVGWIGANCETNEWLAIEGYTYTKNGQPIGVAATPSAWAPIPSGSIAENAFVLLCDRPRI